MELLRKYGVQTDLYFPLIKRAVVDFAVAADFTHSAGDTKVSKDGGAAANTTNAPSAITMGNGAMWKLTLTATEMQAAKIKITVVDAATKAVEDQMIVIATYGHASAEHAVDLDDAVRAGLTALPNAAAEAAGGLYTRGSGAGQIAQPANGQIDARVAAVLDAVLTAAKFADGFLTNAKAADGFLTAAKLTDGLLTSPKFADAFLTLAKFGADVNTYQAKVWLFDDDGGSADRYVVAFFKNGQPVTAGITSPTIQVWKASDGADLIASVALTQIASTGTYKKDALTTERVADGAAYIAKVAATIDGSSRSWLQPVGRDS